MILAPCRNASATNWGFYLADEPSGREFEKLAGPVLRLLAVRGITDPLASPYVSMWLADATGMHTGRAATWQPHPPLPLPLPLQSAAANPPSTVLSAPS